MSRTPSPSADDSSADEPFRPLPLQELLTLFARHLATQPDAVSVRERRTATTVLLELGVADVDRGRMIGKEGRMLASLRALLGAVAAREQLKVVVELIPDALR